MADSGAAADVAVGRIVSPHGVTGAVKVEPYSDFRERYPQLTGVKVYLGNPGSPPLLDCQASISVSEVSAYGRFWLIRFEQVKSREEAQKLKGLLLYISAEDRLPLPAGSYYYDQIIGLEVYCSGKPRGKVVEVRPVPAHDLYVILGDGGKELLLPAVKEFVKKIDLERGIMLVKIPEGLEDL
ncbi:MAG: 16S rRNA processing protein RimM [Firmicutes bacterium]|nr:16S rRNA processing protein RimM [Bacillota bacterium]